MNPLRFRLRVAVLALGAVAGYGSALHHACAHHRQHQADLERHVARVCVDAARGTETPAPSRRW